MVNRRLIVVLAVALVLAVGAAVWGQVARAQGQAVPWPGAPRYQIIPVDDISLGAAKMPGAFLIHNQTGMTWLWTLRAGEGGATGRMGWRYLNVERLHEEVAQDLVVPR